MCVLMLSRHSEVAHDLMLLLSMQIEVAHDLCVTARCVCYCMGDRIMWLIMFVLMLRRQI
jgi:hypothetical protein